MTMKTVKKFVKDHKKGIIAGAALIGTATLVVMGVKGYRKFKIVECSSKVTDIVENMVEPAADKLCLKEFDVPDFPWNLRDTWHENYGSCFIVDGMTLSDMGEFGKHLIGVEGLDGTEELSMVLECLTKKDVTTN